jgi:hypothetical protein
MLKALKSQKPKPPSLLSHASRSQDNQRIPLLLVPPPHQKEFSIGLKSCCISKQQCIVVAK